MKTPSNFNRFHGKWQFLKRIFSFSMLLTFVSSLAGARGTGPHDLSGGDAQVANMLNHYDKSIYFTKNLGQFRSQVMYRADFDMGQALVTNQGMLIKAYDPATVMLNNTEGKNIEQEMHEGMPFRPFKSALKGHAWIMHFQNPSSSMRIESVQQHPDVFNYFHGSSSSYVTGAPNYQEIWYKNVYKSVDVRYYPAADGTLEYDIICKPGFSARNISIRFIGISRLMVNSSGELELPTNFGNISFPAPVAYQQINGVRTTVTARYRVTNSNVLSFDLGKYNSDYPVIIDPIALRWATWVNTNSTGDNHGHCIWVDPTDGAIYMVARVVGTTDQITVGAFDESANGNLEMIVGKYMEPATVGQSGTRVWQTYIGGAEDDNPYAMEQGPDGNLYITGYTSSSDFPLLGGSGFSGSSIDYRSQSSNNIFVLKINTAGNSIKSSVLGGNSDEGSFDVRVDGSGNPVVCGNTSSSNLGTLFGGQGGANGNQGGTNVLVFKLSQDLSTLMWMKNYGGSNSDVATIMLQNTSNGDLYVGGYTSSSNFPVSNARQATAAGNQSGFLQKLDASGGTVWSSYFQSANNKSTSILSMAFSNAMDQIYFGGVTSGLASSNESASGVFDNSHNGSNDFFVCRMDTNQNFVASTYLGGTGNEVNMMGLNTDQNSDVYIFGYSSSTDFPVSSLPNTPLQDTKMGDNDKTFSKISSSLSSLLFSTYFGGSDDDYDPVGERGIKFSNCRIYTIVTSQSDDLPLTDGALNTTKNSSSSVYEPGLVVWANPPDLLGNTISGDQGICAGATPGEISGSVPAYVLPVITRDGITSSYPSLGSGVTYQWQISTDSTNWSDIAGANNQNLTSAEIGPLYVKTFFRRIIGGDACILAGAADQVVTINLASITGTVTDAGCNGGSTGSISISMNGTSPFIYNWSNGETSDLATGLAAGAYSVTVTDANGCSASASFTVAEPTAMQINTSGSTVTCNSGPGEVTASVTGGTPSYNFSWDTNPVQTSATATGLNPGTYTVTVTDGHQCSATATAVVGEANPLLAQLVLHDANCNNNDGSIEVNVTSGTAPFTYDWSPNVSSTNTATGLSAGLYEVTVTDANGCSTTLSGFINASGISAFVVSQSDATCSNGDNGSATVGGSGGTAPYSFLWMPGGDTTATVQHLSPGTYTVRVSDYLGCPAYVNVVIGFINEAPEVDLGEDITACLNTDVELDAGAGFQSYLWSTNATTQTITVSGNGNYSVLVTDANGCQNLDGIDVTFEPCGVSRMTQIEELSPGITVYPNPAHNHITLRFTSEDPGKVMIRINDVTGRTVYALQNATVKDMESGINIESFHSGIYFLHISGDGFESIIKLVKE